MAEDEASKALVRSGAAWLLGRFSAALKWHLFALADARSEAAPLKRQALQLGFTSGRSSTEGKMQGMYKDKSQTTWLSKKLS